MLSRAGVAVVMLAVAGPVAADSLWIGGASLAGETRVGYLAHVRPLPGRRLSDGWRQSFAIDGVTYAYRRGDEEIEGFSRGVKYTLAREFRVGDASFEVGLGASLRRNDLTPDDPGNENRGRHARGVVELQWRSGQDGPWRGQAFGQYTAGAREHFAMAFVGWRAGNAYVGPRVSTSGDPSYRIHGLGLAANGWKHGNAEVGAHLGAQHSERGGTHAEIGLSVVLYRP